MIPHHVCKLHAVIPHHECKLQAVQAHPVRAQLQSLPTTPQHAKLHAQAWPSLLAKN